ncbi:MAG: TonB-dependent receptor [Bacteroidales bacterium]
MKKYIWIALFMLFLSLKLYAQQSTDYLKGKVFEQIADNSKQPLFSANVHWLGTTVGTTTNEKGDFSISRLKQSTKLVVSFIGFQNDTIETLGKNNIEVTLKSSVELDEVTVVHRRKSTEISMLASVKVEILSEKELQKAACCNLSESFETSPSVDVSFTDAVTGTRQIQMLGLAGPYVQITRENIPDIRGLSAIYGLSHVPGTWIESIQLNKGAGSVANGFESITGQINVELRKPEESERLYLNLYANQEGNFEGNLHLAQKVNDKWSTGLLLHSKNNSFKHDQNMDGFLDNPLSTYYIGLNRWKYQDSSGVEAQLGVKGTFIESTGGQLKFNPETDAMTTNYWGMQMNVNRYEAWTKIGKVFQDKPGHSVGFQLNWTTHEQKSYFGINTYDATQHVGYANLLYQGIIGNTNHKFRTGASFQYDNFDEHFNDTVFKRNEMVPGAYFEYTYSHLEKFSLVAGLRADYHNVFGAFVTPRLHLRYAITEKTVLRASAGRGQRTASILSENSGLFASSRKIVIQGENKGDPYGLDPEVAWNYGLNFTQNFTIYYRDGSVSLDFYRTDFSNQIVIDLDKNPQEVNFYNLDGKSYANSFQAQLDYELIKRLDFRLAYRWYDVKATYNGILEDKPLVASHRAFFNLAYETRNHWKFDYTINWQGKKRIPFTESNPTEYQLDEFSPSFYLMNAQISKTWKEKFEVYLGGENLLDYMQPNPIISNEDPFGAYFDGSMIWGPVMGRIVYLGIRYRIK